MGLSNKNQKVQKFLIKTLNSANAQNQTLEKQHIFAIERNTSFLCCEAHFGQFGRNLLQRWTENAICRLKRQFSINLF